MAEAFTKESFKSARRGMGLWIVESAHNVAPSTDMPHSITVYSRTVDKYNILTIFYSHWNLKAFSGNKD